MSVSQFSSSLSDRSGQPDECNSSEAQIRTDISCGVSRKSQSSRTPSSSCRRRARLLQGQLWQQKLEFREGHQRNLTVLEELRKFQSSAFDTMARRTFIVDQNTILELSGRLQELQNEVNCMNDSKDFQDAESVRSGNSHVTSQPGLFPKHPAFEGLLRPPFVSPRRTDGPPNIWDTSGISGNVFCKSTSFFFSSRMELSLEENY